MEDIDKGLSDFPLYDLLRFHRGNDYLRGGF